VNFPVQGSLKRNESNLRTTTSHKKDQWVAKRKLSVLIDDQARMKSDFCAILLLLLLSSSLVIGTEFKLSASDAELGDYFGDDVNIDGNYAIIGARLEDGTTGSGNPGAAYIFKRTNQGNMISWEEVDKLTADDANSGDEFGKSVDISGDFAIVGAVFADFTATDQGCAYIFMRMDGDDWVQQKKLVADDAGNNDEFGHSVAIDGDIALAGAHKDDGNRGSAYLFGRNVDGTDNWGQIQKLTASDGNTGDSFGHSVSIANSGIFVAVGAPYNDELGANKGAVYLFESNGTTWEEKVKLTASDAAIGLEEKYFGYAVDISSISGGEVIVGSHGEDSSRGSAFIFTREESGSWNEVKKLVPENGDAMDRFAFSVSISGNIAICSAHGDDDLASEAGAAYVFHRHWNGTDNWGQLLKVFSSDWSSFDSWSYDAVAIAGDMAVIGNRLDSETATVAGAAYIKTGITFSQVAAGLGSDTFDGLFCFIGAGMENLMTGSKSSSIVAGESNSVRNGFASLIVGGSSNTISGANSSILGGAWNSVEGDDSVAVCGRGCFAHADATMLFGQALSATNPNTVVIGNGGCSDNGEGSVTICSSSDTWIDGTNFTLLREQVALLDVTVLNSEVASLQQTISNQAQTNDEQAQTIASLQQSLTDLQNSIRTECIESRRRLQASDPCFTTEGEPPKSSMEIPVAIIAGAAGGGGLCFIIAILAFFMLRTKTQPAPNEETVAGKL